MVWFAPYTQIGIVFTFNNNILLHLSDSCIIRYLYKQVIIIKNSQCAIAVCERDQEKRPIEEVTWCRFIPQVHSHNITFNIRTADDRKPIHISVFPFLSDAAE